MRVCVEGEGCLLRVCVDLNACGCVCLLGIGGCLWMNLVCEKLLILLLDSNKNPNFKRL